jgi:hypothetical protein
MNKLPKYSNEPNFVGYPLWYVIDDYKCQCNECATISKEEGYSVSKQVNWDDANLWCDECSAKIEAAYIEEETTNG